MDIKIVRTNFLWVLNFGQVGGPDAKIQKHPLGWIFFEIVLKVDLQILPNLRGLFTKKTNFLVFCFYSFLK